MSRSNHGKNRHAWGDHERQSFADGARNKAQTFRDRRKEASRRECRNFRWQG